MVTMKERKFKPKPKSLLSAVEIDRDAGVLEVDRQYAAYEQGLEGINLQRAQTLLEETRVATEMMEDVLRRCRLLAEEAAQDGVTDERRQVLQREADKLVNRYNELAKSTDFSIRHRIEKALDPAFKLEPLSATNLYYLTVFY